MRPAKNKTSFFFCFSLSKVTHIQVPSRRRLHIFLLNQGRHKKLFPADSVNFFPNYVHYLPHHSPAQWQKRINASRILKHKTSPCQVLGIDSNFISWSFSKSFCK